MTEDELRAYQREQVKTLRGIQILLVVISVLLLLLTCYVVLPELFDGR